MPRFPRWHTFAGASACFAPEGARSRLTNFNRQNSPAPSSISRPSTVRTHFVMTRCVLFFKRSRSGWPTRWSSRSCSHTGCPPRHRLPLALVRRRRAHPRRPLQRPTHLSLLCLPFRPLPSLNTKARLHGEQLPRPRNHLPPPPPRRLRPQLPISWTTCSTKTLLASVVRVVAEPKRHAPFTPTLYAYSHT